MTEPTASSERDLPLRGQVAVVTGGSRGIGRAIAAALSGAGATVVIVARTADDLALASALIGDGTSTYAGDAADPEFAAACVDDVVARFDRVDLLVNCAATNRHLGPMIDVELRQFDKTFDLNVRAPLIWSQAVWRAGMRDRGGSIINIASISGLTFGGPIGVYATSKAALIHLTKHLATELGPRVRVNAIAPGLVHTEFARALWEQPGLSDAWPMQRTGDPDDVAGAAVFLASDDARWITGHVLVVDGGAVLSGFALPSFGPEES